MNTILKIITLGVLAMGLVLLVSAAAFAAEDTSEDGTTKIICINDIEQMLQPAEQAVARARAAGQENLAVRAQKALDRARALTDNLGKLNNDCFDGSCDEIVSRLARDHVKQALLYAAGAELIAAGEPADVLLEQAELNEKILDSAYNCAASLVYDENGVREQVKLSEEPSTAENLSNQEEPALVNLNDEGYVDDDLSPCLCLGDVDFEQLAFVGIADEDIVAAGPVTLGGPVITTPPAFSDGPRIFPSPTPTGPFGPLPPPETASGP